MNKMSKRKPEDLKKKEKKQKKPETGPKIKQNYLQGFLQNQVKGSILDVELNSKFAYGNNT